MYFLASTLLGAMFGLLGEVIWLNFFVSPSSAAPMLIPIDKIHLSLYFLFALGGFLVGRVWWRIVYVEHRWARGAKTDKNKPA